LSRDKKLEGGKRNSGLGGKREIQEEAQEVTGDEKAICEF